MNRAWAAGWALSLALCTSCATYTLWHRTDPSEYVVMPQSPATERFLAEHKLQSIKDDPHGLYFVEKSRLRKFKDYTIRTLGTPVTVTLDAATTVLVVGAAGWLIVHGWMPMEGGETGSSDQQQREYQRLYDELRTSGQLNSPSPSPVR